MSLVCDPIPKRLVTVFISYSHDSLVHRRRIWDFAKKLRGDGINAVIDQYNPCPAEGFPTWIENQMDSADFVLLVCTKTYLRRVRGKETMDHGNGARWEGHIIYQNIYERGTKNTKFIPVLLSGSTAAYIPTPLRSVAYYRVDTPDGYDALFRRISDQQQWLAPALGKLRTLPPDVSAPSVVDGPDVKVSLLLKELLSAQTLSDVERCLAKSKALLADWPNNADVMLLHRQVEQALERERIEARRRLRLQMRASDIVAPAVFALYFLFGSPKRAVATVLTVGVGTGVGIGVRRSIINAQQARRIAQEVIRDTPTVTSHADGQLVNINDRPMITGRLGGPAPYPRFLYLVHYGDPGEVIAHPVSVGTDDTWLIDMGTWLQHRRPRVGEFEWQIITFKTPFARPVRDQPSPLPPFLILSPSEVDVVNQTRTASSAVRVRLTAQ